MEVHLGILLETLVSADHSEHSLHNMSNNVASQRQSAAEVILFLSESYSTGGETLVHAIVLLDKYISSSIHNDVSPVLLDQAAVACFMISVKFRETLHPTVSDLRQLTSFSCEDLLECEQAVMAALGWNICVVSGM
jgi:hypothetical protein